jgi:predicted ATPase
MVLSSATGPVISDVGQVNLTNKTKVKNNMNKLKFIDKHLSIQSLDDVEIPDFAVITGLNGSGKSQLLDAICLGKISYNNIHIKRISIFNNESYKLDDESACNYNMIVEDRKAAWNKFQSGYIVPEKMRKSLVGGNIKKTVDDNLAIEEYGLGKVVLTIGRPLDELSEGEFIQHYNGVARKNKTIPTQLGKVFWQYYLKQEENALKLHHADINHPGYSESEFVKIHGEPPWLVLGGILSRFSSIDYNIDSPSGKSPFGNYILKLVSKDSGAEIKFSDLSSGEKTLMALVATIYGSTLDSVFPDLLLLDEVDASLHPGMTKVLLNVIIEEIVRRGTKVILITHSPSTIALSCDTSIFILTKGPNKKLVNYEKSSALNILTEGYATLGKGLELFEKLSRNKITVITEGNNALILKCLFEVYEVSDIEVIEGAEQISGTSQLKTLFDFMKVISHSLKIVFIFDCDYKQSFESINNTYAISIRQYRENTLAPKGIENALPIELLNEFTKKIIKFDKTEIIQFDESAKTIVANKLNTRKNKNDFCNLAYLIDDIRTLTCPTS